MKSRNRSSSRNTCCHPNLLLKTFGINSGCSLRLKKTSFCENPQDKTGRELGGDSFEIITSPDANLAEGQTRIVAAGVNGQRRLVTKVSMVNDQEVREVIEDQ